MKQLTLAARILVVEDEALVAEEIALRLERLGYRVIGGAASADDAVLAAAELRPDLVLMDIRLRGGGDGIAAAERICRQIDVPVVYLTAHSDESTLERARSSGPFGYVLKPFQEKELVMTIEMALQRHGVEQRLRESETRYATTLRSIGDAVIATDAQRRVTFMNPVAEALTGWRLPTAEGHPIDEVAPLVEEGSGRVEHPIDRALRSRAVVHTGEDMALIDQRGQRIPIEDSASPIVDDHGSVLGAVMAFRDCRARRRANEALRQAEERLQVAQRLEAVGRLAGGVAHDFNNLLTVVLGCGELLRQGVSSEEARQGLVEEIIAAGRRAASLTDQLLAYGRRRVLRPRVVDLNELVRGLEGLLSRLLPEDVLLELAICPESLPVHVDPGEIEHVLINLAANARDAMEATGGALILRTALSGPTDSGRPPELGSSPWALLQVSDTGHGMDEETRDRIFEPFFTTKEVGRGTGLGLATVYGTVTQSSGHIDVASEVGRGTAVSVFLPLREEIVEKPRVEPSAGEVGGQESILLVEDDSLVRRVLSRGLRSIGYNVLEAERADEALQVARAAGPDLQLLVTDVVLPGRNGRLLAEALRAERPDLPVLYLSGHNDDAVLVRGVEEGRLPFLRKPFTPMQLAHAVRTLLEERGRPS